MNKLLIEELELPSGEVLVDFEVPTRMEVCERCEGHGTHCNPSIGAITAEEWERDWDEDSREGYFAGRYDVTCEECGGANVVPVPDYERIGNAEIRAAVEKHYRLEAQYEAEDRRAREMGY